MFENNSAAVSSRLAGVKIAKEATSNDGRGKPNTVTGVVKGEIVFVGFNDERGNSATAMCFKAGDRYMATKDTVEWCGTKLFPMAPWMIPQLERAMAAQTPVELPTDDAADVGAAVDVVDVVEP